MRGESGAARLACGVRHVCLADPLTSAALPWPLVGRAVQVLAQLPALEEADLSFNIYMVRGRRCSAQATPKHQQQLSRRLAGAVARCTCLSLGLGAPLPCARPRRRRRSACGR